MPDRACPICTFVQEGKFSLQCEMCGSPLTGASAGADDMVAVDLSEEFQKMLAEKDQEMEELKRQLLARQQSSQRHREAEERLEKENKQLEGQINEVERVARQEGAAELMKEATEAYPETWTPDQKETCKMVMVEKDSEEWKEIEELFLGKGEAWEMSSSCNIVSIGRIQNRHLWLLFAAERARVTIKNGDANVQRMFHGTRNTRPQIIYNSVRGFDHGKSGSGMWGQGIYFSQNAKFVDSNYKHTVPGSSNRQMFCSLVIQGEAKDFGSTSQSGLRRPPEKAPYTEGVIHEFYDSVQANLSASCPGHEGKMTIVYDNCCCYPDYLVTYAP